MALILQYTDLGSTIDDIVVSCFSAVNFILFEQSYTYLVPYQTKTKLNLSRLCVSIHMSLDKTNLPLHLAVVGIPRCT